MTIRTAKAIKIIFYLVAALIILGGLLVSVGRLSQPYLTQHRHDFENWASEAFHKTTTIGKVKLTWHYFEPVISFSDVTVLNSTTHKHTLHARLVKVNLMIFSSIWHRKLLPGRVLVSGVRLTFHQLDTGNVKVEGLSNEFSLTDNLTGESLETQAALAWIFSQPELSLQDIDIHFFTNAKKQESISLKDLNLENSNTKHILTGDAELNQEVPTKININLDWKGDITHLDQITAHIFLHIEGLSLPQWFGQYNWQQLRINQGLGSFKIWADWDKSTWQKIQTRFQFYELEIQSLQNQKTQVFPRLSGHLGWKRDAGRETFAGDQILIDLPQHLWPTTNFTVTMTRDSNGKRLLQDLQIGYIDIGDIKQILLDSSSLSNDVQNQMKAINPQGEIHDFHVSSPESVFNNFEKMTIASDFTGLSFHTWQNYPGATNLSGHMSWDKNQGDLKLNSMQSTLTFNKLFFNPLVFNQLQAFFTIQKTPTGVWLVQAKNIVVANADLKALTDVTLSIPLADSPTINLVSSFTVANAAHVSTYLPMKVFEPNLVEWLSKAFLSGTIDSGKAILQGKLSDFPFDGKNGWFLIHSNLHDVKLNFAPDWPLLQKVNGTLVFSGNSMEANVDSGQLTGIPLNQIHATISNLNSDPTKPAVLSVKTLINSDLEQGLYFLHNSPLEKTIGKHLGEMRLNGPMQLNFSLDIPLKKIANLKVLGDATIHDATMNLPTWKLMYENIKGGFQFTENSVTANNLQGKIFGEDASLKLMTTPVAGKEPEVQGVLQSRMTVATLEKWINFPLSKTLAGVLNFDANLQLTAEDNSTIPLVSISSDLVGLSVNLPDPYGKKAEVSREFKLSIFKDAKHFLKTKLKYNGILTAALIFDQQAGELSFTSGDVRLGNQGQADWPNEKGLIVTGNIDVLDWNSIESQFATDKKEKSVIPPIRAINIVVGKFSGFGQQIENLRLQVAHSQAAWLIDINNTDMSGHLSVPFNLISNPITANFQRLHINPAVITKTETVVNPKKFPPISFVGDDVSYDNRQFGHVVLTLSKSISGLVINQFTMTSPFFSMRAMGEWEASSNGRNRTHLRGDLTSNKISDALNGWGLHASNLIGSTGNVTFDLVWLDALFNPSMATLSGNVSIKLGKGRIVDIGASSDAQMGLARMLNVFSLKTLPRRLKLDFSDLFEKGYSFDLMKGDFTLHDGNAVTQNASIDGPDARVDLNGRIGLQAKDFDVFLNVTPYVTSSLPVATAIWNPLAGLAVWAVEKMVSHEVSKLTTYHYVITGSWANPQRRELNAKTPAEDPR